MFERCLTEPNPTRHAGRTSTTVEHAVKSSDRMNGSPLLKSIGIWSPNAFCFCPSLESHGNQTLRLKDIVFNVLEDLFYVGVILMEKHVKLSKIKPKNVPIQL